MKILESSKKREALLEAMIGNARDAFIVIDAHDIVHTWNPEAERLFGWTQHEAVGQPLSGLIMSEKAAIAHKKGMASYVETGAHWILNKRIEVTALHRNGQRRPIELTVTPINLNGSVFFSAAVRDLTEKRIADEQLQQHQQALQAAYEALRKSQTELQEAMHANRRLMEYSLDVICAINQAGIILQVSSVSEKLWGYRMDELIGQPYLDFIHPHDRNPTATETRKSCTSTSCLIIENRFIHKNGDIINMMWTMNWSHSDSVYYCVARDITAIKKVVYELAQSNQRFHSLFEHHPDGIFAFDAGGRLTSANQAFSELTGYPIAELYSMPYCAFVTSNNLELFSANFSAALRGEAATFETIGRRKDGSCYEASVTTVPIVVNEKMVGVHGMVRDITHSKNYERNIQRLATYDNVTGLPNRNLLDDRIKHAIAQADRQGCRVGILFLDLNRFKIVNDSLGHDKGDLLLRIMADRLKQCVRESDTVARIGGDEFVIVLHDVALPDAVIAVTKNVLAVLEKPVLLDDHEFVISGSIGCSLYPKDGPDAATLLRNADMAMYEAKAVGSGAFRLYKADMNERVKSRLMHEHHLRRALEKEELVVYYQPRVDLNSNAIVGAEALVRWRHPERGLVAPNEFIPLAEEIGVIGQLGEWVLKAACSQLRAWQNAGLPALKVSVNLSPYQLAPDSEITEIVRQALQQTELDAQWLELEITETSLMENVESTLVKLAELQREGISISIDDFGTGYSSLSYLRRLPVNGLKIDQSFIRDISVNRDDAAIVSATIGLAHTLNLKVVAEGVATQEQIYFLEENDCDEVQGYLFGAAVPADEFVHLLRRIPYHRPRAR